jgi:hypothetical protein
LIGVDRCQAWVELQAELPIGADGDLWGDLETAYELGNRFDPSMNSASAAIERLRGELRYECGEISASEHVDMDDARTVVPLHQVLGSEQD